MGRRKTVTRRPNYGDAIRWIAFNDNAGSDDGAEEIESYISTALVADLFGARLDSVALDVANVRCNSGKFRDTSIHAEVFGSHCENCGDEFIDDRRFRCHSCRKLVGMCCVGDTLPFECSDCYMGSHDIRDSHSAGRGYTSTH